MVDVEPVGDEKGNEKEGCNEGDIGLNRIESHQDKGSFDGTEDTERCENVEDGFKGNDSELARVNGVEEEQERSQVKRSSWKRMARKNSNEPQGSYVGSKKRLVDMIAMDIDEVDKNRDYEPKKARNFDILAAEVGESQPCRSQ